MCFRVRELLWAHRMPAVREFQPIFYSYGQGWRLQAQSSSHRFPFLWGRGLTAPSQEVPEGTRGCVRFPFEGPPWSPGAQTRIPGPFLPSQTHFPAPTEKRDTAEGTVHRNSGGHFHLVPSCYHMHSVTTVSVYLVFCSPTAKQPGHLTSKDFMPFPSS